MSAVTTSVPVTRTIRSAQITATVSVEIATATKLLTVGFYQDFIEHRYLVRVYKILVCCVHAEGLSVNLRFQHGKWVTRSIT